MQSISNNQVQETFQKMDSSFRHFFGTPGDAKELWVYGLPGETGGKDPQKINPSTTSCTNPTGGKFK
jgi:hypothetical protein